MEVDVNQSGNEACIFCKIAQKQMPSNIVYEDEEVVAFPDLKPIAPLHFLIIPKRHLSSLADATEPDYAMLGRLLGTANILAKTKGLTDFRTVINSGPGAGQSVFHLHLHLLGGRPFHWPPG